MHQCIRQLTGTIYQTKSNVVSVAQMYRKLCRTISEKNWKTDETIGH